MKFLLIPLVLAVTEPPRFLVTKPPVTQPPSPPVVVLPLVYPLRTPFGTGLWSVGNPDSGYFTNWTNADGEYLLRCVTNTSSTTPVAVPWEDMNFAFNYRSALEYNLPFRP